MIPSSSARPLSPVPTTPRTLAAAPDGIWLWPAVPLTARRGATVVPLAKDSVYHAITRLHGFGAVQSRIWPAVEAAAGAINRGDLLAAQTALDHAGLPPLSADGVAFAKAVAGRLGVTLPDVPIGRTARLLGAEDIAALARCYDDRAALARRLQPLFVPKGELAKGTWVEALHPRWPAGVPEGGEFLAVLGEAAPALEAAAGAAALPVAATVLGVGLFAHRTGGIVDGPVPGRPDLAYRYVGDTGELLVLRAADTSRWAGSKSPPLLVAHNEGRVLVDATSGEPVGRMGQGEILLDPGVLANLPPAGHAVPPLAGRPATPPSVADASPLSVDLREPQAEPESHPDGVALPGSLPNLPPDEPFDPFDERSTPLRGNMEKAGIEFGPNEVAHHLVPHGAKDAKRARDKLEKYGIGIHSAENGMALPRSYHDRMHDKDYYGKLKKSFKGIRSRKRARAALEEMRHHIMKDKADRGH
jgi:hypothetical protein